MATIIYYCYNHGCTGGGTADFLQKCISGPTYRGSGTGPNMFWEIHEGNNDSESK